MSKRNKLPGNISIEQIVISIDTCPGCEREHEFNMKRPTTIHNCSRQKGSFTATASSGGGQITVTVYFTGTDFRQHEVTNQCNISFT